MKSPAYPNQAVEKPKESEGGYGRIWKNSLGKKVHLMWEEIRINLEGEKHLLFADTIERAQEIWIVYGKQEPFCNFGGIRF